MSSSFEGWMSARYSNAMPTVWRKRHRRPRAFCGEARQLPDRARCDPDHTTSAIHSIERGTYVNDTVRNFAPNTLGRGGSFFMSSSRALRVAIVALVAALASGLFARPASAGIGVPQVYLKVLVVTDGSVWVEAIRQQLASEGVPTTVIDLNSPSRQTITKAFLSSTPLLGIQKAFFQGVVLPSNFVPGLSTAEMNALATYEQTFAIRQVEGYVFPNADI